MLITKLKLNYFGRFRSKEIELKPGINLICGDNEAGKTTIHSFIKGMLFGIERLRGRGSASKEDTYTRYLPWDYPGAYSGCMDIEIGENTYRLQRSFHANNKNFTILDLSTGREIKLKEGLISELVPGLTESTFRNTISIEQLKAQTDSELAGQVRNYIANLSITKSKEINVAKAINILTDQRKQLEAAQNITVLKELQTEIEKGMEKELIIDRLTLQLKELLEKEQQLKKKKTLLEASLNNDDTRRMEQFPAILEKYRSFQEMTKQLEILEHQEKELRDKISAGQRDQLTTDSMKEDLNEAEQLRWTLSELETQEAELRRELEECRNRVKRNRWISLFPSVILAILIFLISGGQPIGIGVALVFLGAGVTAYSILNKKSRQALLYIETQQNDSACQKMSIQGKIEKILTKYQVARVESLSQKLEGILRQYYTLEHTKQQKTELEQRKKELEDNIDLIYESIMKYMQYFIKEEELTQFSMQKLQEEIRSKKQFIQSKITEINQAYESCKLQIEKLRWEIEAMEGNEEQLLKNKESFTEIEQKYKDNATELEALKLSLSTIQELSTDIHDSFGQQLNQAVSDIIREVTGEKYQDLKVDEKLEVKVGWKGDYVLLDRLSAGTIEQVYLALRLAVADLLLGKDEVPLLLDDSFALYDENRVRHALEKISQKKQILVFTCHRREQELLKDMGLPYHLVDLSHE